MALFGQIASAYVEVESRPDSRFKQRIVREAEVAGGQAGRRGGSQFAGMFSGLAGKAVLGLAAGATAGLGALGFMGLKTAANLEQAQISFETLLGSGKEARSFLGELKDFAAKTPFELPGLQDAARQMLGTGRAAEDVIPALTAWGDAAGALGLSQEQFGRAQLAANQAMSKGKLQAEEMMQITEAGIPVWQLLSKALDLPIPKLQEMASSGELIASEVLPKLEDQMRKDYGGSMAKQSQTLAGLWSTLMDTINLGSAEALQPLIPILQEQLPGAIEFVGKALTAGARGMARLVDVGKRVGEGMGVLQGHLASARETAQPFLNMLGQLVERLTTTGGAVGPSGPLAQGLGQLRSLWAKVFPQLSEIARTALQLVRGIIRGAVAFFTGIWQRGGQQMMATWSRLWRAVQDLMQGALQVVQGVLDVFVGAFTGDWRRAWRGVQGIFAGAWRAITAILRGAVDVLRGVLRGFVSVVQTLWSGLWTRMRNTASSALRAITGWFSDRLGAAQRTVERVSRIVREAFWNMMDKARDAVRDRLNAIVRWFANLPGRIADAVKDLAGTVKDKIQSVLSGITAKLNISALFSGDGPGRAGAASGGNAVNRMRQLAAGLPVSLSSAYRTPARNAAVGGSPTSYHLDRNNPAGDWVGPAWALDALYRRAVRAGGWRELLWRVSGHFDHLHAANRGGLMGLMGGMRGANRDQLLAFLTPGEFVTNREETDRWLPLLQAINSGQLTRMMQGFNRGGLVKAAREVLRRLRGRGGIFEDLSYRGASRNLSRYNDQLSELIYDRLGSGFDFGQRGTRRRLRRALRGLVDDLTDKPQGRRGGGGGGGSRPLVYIENMNVFDPRRAARALREEFAYAELMEVTGGAR